VHATTRARSAVLLQVALRSLFALSRSYAPGASPDTRNYRVDFSKIERLVPGFRPTWTVKQGVEELLDAYRRVSLTKESFLGPRFYRIQTVKGRQAAGELDGDLRAAG
jgi:hypothetical protein